MIKHLKQKLQEGFTLVEILIVVVIIGILAAIAIPTYFKYVERGYASDAKVQMKNILENSKLYYSENAEFPEDVETMNSEGYANVQRSTLDKWSFTIDLSYDDTEGITGQITAESTDKMKGGAGKTIIMELKDGRFYGYGAEEQEGS
jgi:prepilin-type N-terminal cleavage/methylation domain-containing protein